MKKISCLVKTFKNIFKACFVKSLYRNCCKNCKNRDESKTILMEEYSTTRSFKEKQRFYCAKHNRYVELDEFCHDYDRS